MSYKHFEQRSRYHGWLPKHPEVHKAFLQKHVTSTIRGPNAPAKIWVTEFINAIKDDPLTEQMFEQVNKDPKWEANDEDYRVRDIEHLQNALNSIVQGPPEVYVVRNDAGQEIGEPIGVPIYLVLDLLSNSSAAYDLFRSTEFNDAMKKLLNEWANYLQGSDSNTTLTMEDNGWFGPTGLPLLQSGLQGQTFEYTYGVKPEEAQDPEKGYATWDAFFVREFKPSIDARRPLQTFYDSSVTVIYNACESACVRTVDNVKLHDTFWLKGQNVSLYDMFGAHKDTSPDPNPSVYAEQFVGGSVYQAFLSPQDYHHWHSPVAGTVVARAIIPGTYYAVLPDGGAPADDPDLKQGDPHGALIRSQPWLSVAAARGMVILKPTEPSDLDLVAVSAIGMAEVSSITIEDDITVGQPVEAGQRLGKFHFGGSTHVVVLKPKVGKKVEFKDIYDIDITAGQHRWIRTIIGRLVDDK